MNAAGHLAGMDERRTRRLAAVWFADIVGYTALSTRDEDAALAVVDEFQRLSKESVGDKGRVVKFLGDGALAIFDSTNRALESAIALRDAFAASEVARRHGCTLSVGVHVGEVVQAEDGDVYGDGVNVASRIEGVATSNQVVVSEGVYRLIRNRSGYNPQSIGEHMLKGLDKPAPLYVLARPGEKVAAAQLTGGVRADGDHRRAVAIGTFAGLAGFVALSMFVAWSVNFPDDSPGDAADREPIQNPSAVTAPSPAGDASPTDDRARSADGARNVTADAATTGPTRATQPPIAQPRSSALDRSAAGSTPPATASPAPSSPVSDATVANKLLVMVFGEAAANQAEEPILRSLGSVDGVTVVDAPAAALLRRNPDAARAALQGDLPALAETARRNGIEYLLLGSLESDAVPLRGNMYSGSAQLGLRMYRVSTGEIVDQGTFTTGVGSEPGTAGRTEIGVRAQAAQAVGRQGAVAARRWLLGALRN